MGIEPTRDLISPTLVLKTRGTTRHQSPPLRYNSKNEVFASLLKNVCLWLSTRVYHNPPRYAKLYAKSFMPLFLLDDLWVTAIISGDRDPLDLRHAVNTTLFKHPSGTTHKSLVVILRFLVHFFSCTPGCRSIYSPWRPFPDFRARREGSPVRPPFAGHRRGRSLRNAYVLNR